MLERLVVHNFQSLRSVEVEMGRFTVIVGASNSGKSALIRAIRTLASNMRGATAITRGAKSCAITAHTGDAIVTLERSDSTGLYRIARPDGTEEIFTKLAGAVPAQVTDTLRIAPVPTNGTSINFAGQLDRPYLLDDSGANVARVLGTLTNVNTIFEAVREANRRRNALAATLRTREADLADLTTRAATFHTLPARLNACARAEVAAENAARLTDRAARLDTAIQRLTIADGVLARTATPPAIPDDIKLINAQTRLDTLRALLRTWMSAGRTAAAATTTAEQAAAVETALHAELHDTLVRAGTCPTCGRPVAA